MRITLKYCQNKVTKAQIQWKFFFSLKRFSVFEWIQIIVAKPGMFRKTMEQQQWTNPLSNLMKIYPKMCILFYITCHLADAFIQSDLQLIRLSRRHTPWSNVGLRALLKGPTAVRILSWPHQGSNHRPWQHPSSLLTVKLVYFWSCHSISIGLK